MKDAAEEQSCIPRARTVFACFMPSKRSSLLAKKPANLLLKEVGSGHGLRPVLGPFSSPVSASARSSAPASSSSSAWPPKTRPGAATDAVVCGRRVRLRLCRALLRGVRLDGAGGRLRLHLRLRDARRALRLDHRLGSGPRICASAQPRVANGWSQYFQTFSRLLGIHCPTTFTNAPFDYNPATAVRCHRRIIDLPALLISALLTGVLVIGIRERGVQRHHGLHQAGGGAFVIAVGVFYIDPRNWQPFAPYGYSGISFFGKTIWGSTDQAASRSACMAGAAIVFFAYIGFDSVSTHAEEARNPSATCRSASSPRLCSARFSISRWRRC